MATYPCASCGRMINPAVRCPYCGTVNTFQDEISRIDAAMAELKQKDMKLAKERAQLAADLNTAIFQRDTLRAANTVREKAQEKARTQTRRTRRRTVRPAASPRPTAEAGTTTVIMDEPPPPPRRPRVQPMSEEPLPEHAETSSRSVQNLILGLAWLVLGTAAVVFAAVAIGNVDSVARVGVLLVAAVAALALAPVVERRGLSSTAETISAIGIVLVPLGGYAIHEVVSTASDEIFLGVTFAVTAGIAAAYAGVTSLATPRYAMVLALQPVLPLLLSRAAGNSATAWALILTLVAVLDLALTRVLLRFGTLAPSWPGGRTVTVPPQRRGAEQRPEGYDEEPDAVLNNTTERRAPSGRYLTELIWALFGVAVATALFFATIAVLRAGTPPAAYRSALVLLLAAGAGLAGAMLLRRPGLRDLAAGAMTLAVIGAIARIASVAVPGRALVTIAAAAALTGVGIRLLPAYLRRGPQLAAAVALTVLTLVIALQAIPASIAPIRAALPPWGTDLSTHAARMAEFAGEPGWQLALSALLVTIAAALALPGEVRYESAVAGVAVTALTVPASLGLLWSEAPWPLVVGAIGIGLAGLAARTRNAAYAHVIAAAVVGLAGAGAAVSRPWLTAAVLTALAGAGVMIAVGSQLIPRERLFAWVIGDWAKGGAAFAFPGAVAAAVAAISTPGDQGATLPILAAAFLAVSVTLGYAAISQVAHRAVSMPVTVGAGLGALAVTAASFGADRASAADALVGALMLVAAVLLFLTPQIDSGRRSDRVLDGADVAAAAATVAVIGALARVGAIVFPDAQLGVAALMVLLVAAGAWLLPADWRRGPTTGVTVAGAVVVAIAGYLAIGAGLRALAISGSLWDADLNSWTTSPATGGAEVPLALLMLAGAAVLALNRPLAYNAAAACVALATVSAPAALGWPWWSPIVVGCLVAAVCGVLAVMTIVPSAGYARVAAAIAVSLHAAAASLVRPWTTSAALAMIAAIGVLVAALAGDQGPIARRVRAARATRGDLEAAQIELPRHLSVIGGFAAGGALLALPGVFAGVAAHLGRGVDVVLLSALAGSALGLAVLAVVGRNIPQYLPYTTIGVTGGATVTALASLPTDHPAALYAAAAALLGVLAELLRGSTSPPTRVVTTTQTWSPTASGRFQDFFSRAVTVSRRWTVSPAMGALYAGAIPAIIAVVLILPYLVASLVTPYQQLQLIWGGPVDALLDPLPDRPLDGTSVLAALLLTGVATLAALGFSGDRPLLSVPVILPGLAVTILIMPVALDYNWPASTLAALAVFTIAMLGLALTPTLHTAAARPLRASRSLVFVIGLMAGGAGLTGALATRPLTLFTLAAAVGVGMVAALAGRVEIARILGWLFAAVMAQLFVVTLLLTAGRDRYWAAFAVLAVGAALLIASSMLPRLRDPRTVREAYAVEWAGYAAALLALALAFDSARHVAALLAAWGAVLGLASSRPGRPESERRMLFWISVGLEVGAWLLLMLVADVALPEAYTLPFAALALLIGWLESRYREELNSWYAYGPALIAAFLPTLVLVISRETTGVRQIALLLGALVCLIIGSRWQQQAPLVIGAVVTTIATLHFIVTMVSAWWVLLPVGGVLLLLGANNENRRRAMAFRGNIGRMR
ncbi:SCO7613 C-terminal domain-containing membrane protein [Catenuloplanes sp. NPDC051500]|uniref:SCO7613 C-terminal domain-containing membrane protein n=1 Tax=Catenuloplanes sp. NPDC051500 TaxID=3363959 RepID=UPI0037B2A321